MTDDTTKECVKCGTRYPATEEFFRRNESGNLRSGCKECERQAANRYYYDNRDDVLAQKKQHRIENPEKFAERDRQRYLKDPEKEKGRWKKYRDEHPEERKAAMKNWRDENPDAVKAYTAEYYQKNAPALRLKSRRTYIEKRDIYLTYGKKASIKRRALLATIEGSFGWQDLQNIYHEQEGRCAYCGISLCWEIRGDIHIDHVQPLSKGGSNYPDNLALACAGCNLSKKDKTLEAWQEWRGW